jgi:hypothetical protein
MGPTIEWYYRNMKRKENIVSDPVDILSMLCKHKKKWGLYLCLPDICDEKYYPIFFGPNATFKTHYPKFRQELKQAVPYLSDSYLFEQNIYLFFKSERAMLWHYNRTVGDVGPTRSNRYNGSIRVYALTCNPRGQTLNENT